MSLMIEKESRQSAVCLASTSILAANANACFTRPRRGNEEELGSPAPALHALTSRSRETHTINGDKLVTVRDSTHGIIRTRTPYSTMYMYSKAGTTTTMHPPASSRTVLTNHDLSSFNAPGSGDGDDDYPRLAGLTQAKPARIVRIAHHHQMLTAPSSPKIIQ